MPRKALGRAAANKERERMARFKTFSKQVTEVRRKYAKGIADAAREMGAAARRALALHEAMLAECETFAGEGVDSVLTISFEPFPGGIEAQREDDFDVDFAGFQDVVALADYIDTAVADVMLYADEALVVGDVLEEAGISTAALS